MAKIVQYQEFGGPEVLEIVEAPDPVAPPNGVIVETKTVGVNPFDWKIRSGMVPSGPIEGPRRLGGDAAGVISEVGDDVTGWSVGDNVIIRAGSGTYATHVVATPDQLVAKPQTLTWEQASGMGIPVGAAYQAVKSLGVDEGTTLLIHGGAGGVGQAATQFAREWGATIIATARPENHERLKELGATPVEYGPGLTERIRAVAPDGVDAVLDAAGTDEAIDASLAVLKDSSRIGTLVGGKHASERGVHAWFYPLTPEEAAWRKEAAEAAIDLINKGRFDIEVAKTFPLDWVADAHREGESGHIRGKIVLIS